MKKNITKSFFNRDTKKVAQELLGKFLIREYNDKYYIGIITETEAYCGPNDLASHASRGKTPRTEIMFGPPGHIYIYLIYGMYYCLNIVTEKNNYPAAVLIRSIQAFKPIKVISSSINFKNLKPLDYKITNGPGKLCKYFYIDKNLNKKSLAVPYLWIKDSNIKVKKIKKLPRIGVDYAGCYAKKPWRYQAAL
ncbi:MAG: DNA-3-methyladenine glycosylase [Patescibacteria group bacterium]|jgi:DNA-3-methyladenine glycosylase